MLDFQKFAITKMKISDMDLQNIFSKKMLQIVLLLFVSQILFAQKIVRYDLYVRDTIVNYSGKEKRAIAVNGQIPMPTLTFTEGDIAEIYVHNQFTISIHANIEFILNTIFCDIMWHHIKEFHDIRHMIEEVLFIIISFNYFHSI